MYIQYGVRLVGIVYLILGILGFIPIDPINHFHPEGIGVFYLLNQVAINWLHNIIHLVIGVTGLWAAQSITRAQLWGKIMGAVLLLLFVVGMGQAVMLGLPKDQWLFGVVPLNSPGHILHLVTGGLALYLGFKSAPEISRASEKLERI
jgi:hypothetical protein